MYVCSYYDGNLIKSTLRILSTCKSIFEYIFLAALNFHPGPSTGPARLIIKMTVDLFSAVGLISSFVSGKRRPLKAIYRAWARYDPGLQRVNKLATTAQIAQRRFRLTAFVTGGLFSSTYLLHQTRHRQTASELHSKFERLSCANKSQVDLSIRIRACPGRAVYTLIHKASK